MGFNDLSKIEGGSKISIQTYYIRRFYISTSPYAFILDPLGLANCCGYYWLKDNKASWICYGVLNSWCWQSSCRSCKHVIYDRCPGTCLLDNTTLNLSFWWSLCAADSLGSSCTDDLAIEGWKKLWSCLWSVQLQMTAPVHLLKGATLQYCQEWTVIIQSTGVHWGRNPWYPWLFLVCLLQRKKCRWDRSHIKSTYKNKDLHTEQKSGEWL